MKTFLAVLVGSFILNEASAATLDVTTSGTELTDALSRAQPGDTVRLEDGTYDSAVVTVRSGKSGEPITIVGSEKAIIKGQKSSRSVHVRHSYITLKVCASSFHFSSTPPTASRVRVTSHLEGDKPPTILK